MMSATWRTNNLSQGAHMVNNYDTQNNVNNLFGKLMYTINYISKEIIMNIAFLSDF